ncbi:glycoside hydrolase family 6 protein [Myceligenerans pegani]|uniref:Glucanase n=1 Tax=Myceligenerans pegani TaxID=2776917 RepID=A0ABR9MW21_9MICO|nr:glycoside hydrolase family 6 protein [Myceligenerans sp. TRM 65318]MBE1875583.1 glycoside hydrolase family 6 protein [Myceligenerans sp. TRM 65318]MBE3017854.1 glycoside hydrolase family 6 protein [Myceligenerans sp. TRM 65318]
MAPSTLRRRLTVALTACALGAGLLNGSTAWASDDVLTPETEFLTNPQSSTKEAARGLRGQAKRDALLLSKLPSATWFTDGTPAGVEQDVRKLVRRAGDKVPVLAAYNIPFRDCALYSAGGALGVEEYKAWIDGFAAGIGNHEAVVVLEPDGLGVIPWYTTLEGQLERCRPPEYDPETTGRDAAAERFEMLNYAVDRLAQQPNAVVYLDGTNPAWLAVGEIADRLVKAGVERADGFFLNASNYLLTENNVSYGTWISQCITYGTQVVPGDFLNCGNQHWNGGPANDWNGVALTHQGVWSPDATDPTLNTAGIESRFDAILGDTEPTTHFVVDTSRNGQGPWAPPADVYPDAETWCNPPDRGLGLRPTADTGEELVDAFLWIKIPGESDGECFRGLGGPEDPERGRINPAAGQWFPEQARELIALADPVLERHGKRCPKPRH